MYFIHKASSINCQKAYQHDNIFRDLITPEDYLMLEEVDYKSLIPPAALRRMSTILKNSLCAAHQLKTEQDFDAIIVGTGLGCLQDTEKFLKTIHISQTETLSPTAFIQSTHNTIAGQISLALNNHGYNMTHTQHTFSFEVALMDAMQAVDDGMNQVLLGAAEEYIPFLDRLSDVVIPHDYPLSQGVSFFNISKTPAQIGITSIQFFNFKNPEEIRKVIHDTHADLLIYNGAKDESIHVKNQVNISQFTGFYLSNSAFAMHVGYDYLKNNPLANKVIIWNNLSQNHQSILVIERK